MLKNARARRLEVTITLDEFLVLSQQNCRYCGKPPSSEFRHTRHSFGTYIYNGLDRVDNDRGYTIDNVAACCAICNDMKGKMGATAFVEQCRRIAEHNSADRRMMAVQEVQADALGDAAGDDGDGSGGAVLRAADRAGGARSGRGAVAVAER